MTGCHTCAHPISGLRDLFRCVFGHDFAAFDAAFWAYIDNPVGGFDDVRLCSITATLLPWSPGREDRMSVVKGKSVSVRVDLGGGRIINHNIPTCITNISDYISINI